MKLFRKCEGVMENSCGLALCGRAGVPEERLAEVIGGSAAQFQQGAPAVLKMSVPWNDMNSISSGIEAARA